MLTTNATAARGLTVPPAGACDGIRLRAAAHSAVAPFTVAVNDVPGVRPRGAPA